MTPERLYIWRIEAKEGYDGFYFFVRITPYGSTLFSNKMYNLFYCRKKLFNIYTSKGVGSFWPQDLIHAQFLQSVLGMTLNSSVVVLIMMLNSFGANTGMVLWVWLQFVLPRLISLFGHTQPAVLASLCAGPMGCISYNMYTVLLFLRCWPNVNVRKYKWLILNY